MFLNQSMPIHEAANQKRSLYFAILFGIVEGRRENPWYAGAVRSGEHRGDQRQLKWHRINHISPVLGKYQTTSI